MYIVHPPFVVHPSNRETLRIFIPSPDFIIREISNVTFIYLSMVKQTKFHVEVTNPAQSNKSPFQIEHSRSPNIPSLLTDKESLTNKETSSSTTEQKKSAKL